MTPNAQVIATLAAYVPRGLPAGAWALAAAPVRAVAARTAPHDPARARGVAWALCVLLAGPYGWDRQAAPDLRELLTPAAIQTVLDVHVASGGRSADHLARHLTQARRTAHALPARSRRTHRMPAISLPVAEMHAIDASSVPAGSLGKRRATDAQRAAGRPATASVDPDADWGYRTVTTDSATKKFFGYHHNAAVTSYTPGSPWQSIKAITAFDLVAANAGLTTSTLNLLDDALLPFAPGTTLLVDRGYSNWVAPAWADQLHARGVTQYLDMRDDNLGYREDPETGVIMFAGWPFSPWTPRHLFTITRPARYSIAPLAPNASAPVRRRHARSAAKVEQFNAQIEALAPYALVRNGRRHAKGHQRFFTRSHGCENATAAQRRTKAFTQETVSVSAAAIVQYDIQVIRRWAATHDLDDADLYDAPADVEDVPRGPRSAANPQRPGAPPAT